MALNALRMLRELNQGLVPFNTLPTWPLYREDRNTALSAESAHHVLGLVRCSLCSRLIKGDGYPDAHTRVVCIDCQTTDTRETFHEKKKYLPNWGEPRGVGFGQPFLFSFL